MSRLCSVYVCLLSAFKVNTDAIPSDWMGLDIGICFSVAQMFRWFIQLKPEQQWLRFF